MAQIQGSDVTLQIRESGTTGSYLSLVCETTNSFDGTTNVNTVNTKCGPLVSLSDPEVNITFDAAVETAPTGTQISYEQMLSYFVNKTLLDVKRADPSDTGLNFFQSGTFYLTALGDTATDGEVMTFTGTLTLNGSLDIIP